MLARRRVGWMLLGGVMLFVGGWWFARELDRRVPLVEDVGAQRGDMPAFELREHDDTGGLGFMLMLLGLVPMVVGVTGFHARSRSARLTLAEELRSAALPIEPPPDLAGVPGPARARLSKLDWISFEVALGVAVLIAVGSSQVPTHAPSPPEPLLREMGLPVAYYRREAQGPIHAKPGRQPQPSEVREVGVARVFSWYGPLPGVTEDQTELAELFATGMDTHNAVCRPSVVLHGEPELDRVAAVATIRRRLPGLQACRAKHEPSGRERDMTFTIELSTEGRVVDVQIDENRSGHAPKDQCMMAKIEDWRFLPEGMREPVKLTFTVYFDMC